MESIDELRRICQESKGNENWVCSSVYRRISIYFTRLLLYTPISANQVTFSRLVLACVWGCLFAFGSYWYALLGAILLNLSNLLDFVDGELARYHQTINIAGDYFDEMTHIFEYAFIFPSISFGVYYSTGDIRVFALGFSGAVFTLVYYYHQIKANTLTHTREMPESLKSVITNITKTPMSLLIFVATSTYLRLNIILVGAVLNQLDMVLLLYGVTLPIACFALLYGTTKSLEKDFRE